MHIWLINEGEALPCDDTKDRLRRMGLLAEQLIARGHRVTWFNSTFYHARKIQRYFQDTKVNISPKYDVQLIWSNSYRRNISLARIKHHRYTAKRFLELADGIDKPDVILCSMPTIELAEAAVIYAKNNNIPVVVDIRDLWPDIFIEMVPKLFRIIIKPYVLHSQGRLVRLLQNADGITALTDSFLQWGLSYSGRNKSSSDRVFNMAYKIGGVTEENNKYWNDIGIEDGDFVVSFFGTIGKQFLLEPILTAAAKLNTVENIKFIICGDGESLVSIKNKALNFRNVKFPGWVNQSKIRSLLELTSLGLAPYRESKNFTLNIPNKFAEYLSAGIPILLSINGEMNDLITKYNCGYIYNNGDELSELIYKIYSDRSLLNILSRNAVNLFKEKFEANKVYSEMSSYLEEISTLNR
ncbi:glycosyltransferase family 4 protein [Syntrophomonas erecta subsp. sporosyntropha]